MTAARSAAPEVITLTGDALTIEQVVQVARAGARVTLEAGALQRMSVARGVVDRALQRGEPVYGSNTGVAARKRANVAGADVAAFNRLLLANHRVGQGPLAGDDVVRAALLRMVNGFARGSTAVRPILAERLVAALNEGVNARVRTLGSVGAADLAQNADLATAVLGDFPLASGEGLALLNNSSFSTGAAALAVNDVRTLLASMETAGALDLEAFAGNVSILHPAIAVARPHRGLADSRARLEALLEGSYLWTNGSERNLQDPLTFRGMPQLFGAARDALTYVEEQLTIELNAAQENPLVIPEEDRVISVWNGEVASLSAALDFLRIALAPVLTSANERLLKLLQSPHSGLTDGLGAGTDPTEDALAELGVAAQSLTVEGRLLAQPVSFELASTTQAEGLEDRTTMAPLAARRLAEMAAIAARIVAIELVVAAQAVELRGVADRLGLGTAAAHRVVRSLVAFLDAGQPLPNDLEPLVGLVREGAFSASCAWPGTPAPPPPASDSRSRPQRSSGASSSRR